MVNLIKKIFPNKKRTVIIFFVVTMIGAIVWNFSKSKADVKTAKIEKGDVQEELVLSGEINADEYANLAFQSSGEIAYVGVKEGELVKKGTVLAKLDTTILYQSYLASQADLRKAEASLDNTYDQLQGNANDENFTQIETRTSAEVNKDKAYRSYVAAQKNLANATLKAPFDGYISAVSFPFTGINTVFTQPQVVMFNPNTVYFETSADQTEVVKLIVGQKVKIILDSFPEETIDGQVSFISNSPKSGEVGAVYKVKVTLTGKVDDYKKYKIGMTGDAKFITAEKRDTLYIPASFIKADANGRYIFVGKKNNKVGVEVGLEGEERVEIKSDNVQVGDTIYD